MLSVEWIQELPRCDLPQSHLSPRQTGHDSPPARLEQPQDSFPEMRAGWLSPYFFRIRLRFHVQALVPSLEPARGSNRHESSRSTESPAGPAPTRLRTLNGCGLRLQFQETLCTTQHGS